MLPKKVTMDLNKRIPEPELMDDLEQARAYSEADFSGPHEMFVDLFSERFGEYIKGTYLDLGCGPCDVTCRFAKRFPECQIHAVDGSKNMLLFAKRRIMAEKLEERIKLFNLTLPFSPNELPLKKYDGLIINSLLHHLSNPDVLWNTIKELIRPGGHIFIMDLKRPSSSEEALKIVEKYSGNEPEILKRDFYNSLLASYKNEEIKAQLIAHHLDHLKIEPVSDRHLVIWGTYQ